MQMKTTYHISTPHEMIELGKKIASKHKKILLYADLWAGKTHFVKWYASGLDIDMDKVHSPTYVYFHEYDDKLLHIDMYRTQDPAHIMRSGILEKIQDYDHICIERPKRESNYIDPTRIKIDIKIDGDNRIVEVS